MKVLGSTKSTVIVELTNHEWMAIGGSSRGWDNEPSFEKVPDVKHMAKALREIRNASPELSRVRAAFQSFLLLTDPAAVDEVLKSCGVAEPVETISEEDLEE